jgi:hypothetical protein
VKSRLASVEKSRRRRRMKMAVRIGERPDEVPTILKDNVDELLYGTKPPVV